MWRASGERRIDGSGRPWFKAVLISWGLKEAATDPTKLSGNEHGVMAAWRR